MLSCGLLLLASIAVSIQEAEDVITDLQKELFKAQGIEGGWGIECLGQVGDTYQDDTDFMKLFVTAVERWLHHSPLAIILHACMLAYHYSGQHCQERSIYQSNLQ